MSLRITCKSVTTKKKEPEIDARHIKLLFGVEVEKEECYLQLVTVNILKH